MTLDVKNFIIVSVVCNSTFEPFFAVPSYVISVERVRLTWSYVMNYFRLHLYDFRLHLYDFCLYLLNLAIERFVCT